MLTQQNDLPLVHDGPPMAAAPLSSASPPHRIARLRTVLVAAVLVPLGIMAMQAALR
jgi:hypothetical protein